MTRFSGLILVGVLAMLPTGCVTRRYLITSDPPGAIVYRNGQPIGPTPVEEPFIYYGKYHFRLVKDGYAPLDVEPELCPPWYQIPGIDFVSENLICYTFHDVQCLHFQLQPVEMARPDDVRARAEQLRQRGQGIQTPPGTEAPRRLPAPAPTPLPPPSPGPAPLPDPTPADSPVTIRPPLPRGTSREPSATPGVIGFPVSRSAGPSPQSP